MSSAKRLRRRLTGWCVLFGCTPFAANADAMIPYMVVPWGQVFLLPLVIIIEAFILRGFLGGGVLAVLLQSFLANVASTLVGTLLYFGTMPFSADAMFRWWFTGTLGTEGLRSALLSLLFAAVLWAISWTIESLVISRMRKIAVRAAAKPCAVANLVTYALLLVLAVWFGGIGK